MKKIVWTLSLLGLTSAAFAGAVEYQEPVLAPSIIVMGVESWYMEPGHSNFIYAENEIVIGNLTQVIRPSVDVDYHWGWHADFSYVMPGDGAFFTFGGSFYEANDSETKPASLDNFGIIGEFNGFARGETSDRYWDLDLVIGKQFTIQDRFHASPFVGIRYANFRADNDAYYTDVFFDEFVGHNDYDNTFVGVGPRGGLDLRVDLTRGLGLIGRAAGSLLIGNSNYRATFTRNNPNLAPALMNATVTFREKTDHDIIPEIDYRIGLNYEYAFSPRVFMGLEMGWQAMEYLEIVELSLDGIAGAAKGPTNWGIQGPYARVEIAIV